MLHPRVPLLATLTLCTLQAQIVVYHETAQVEKATSRQFTAYVPLSPNTIRWSVNGVLGGNATIGTVTQNGLYTAPAIIPMANVVMVEATSTAYPTIKGASRVTITQPQPWVWSANPSSPAAGAQVTLSLNGSAFISSAKVRVNGMEWPTQYVSATSLRATGTFAAAGTYAITVAHPDPGGLISQPVNITVGAAAPITITVSPASATVALSGTQQFTANNPVTWTTTAGTITAAGLFTAPAAMPSTPTVTIRATSTSDTTKFAQATVTLGQPPVTISPATASIALSATQQFTSNLTTGLWTASAGTISATGLYQAPASMPASANVTVRVTDPASSTRYAQATVTLQPPPLPPVSPAYTAAARLLEQAAFGPTQVEIQAVMQKGVNVWLDEQFAMPETQIPMSADMGGVAQSTLNRLSTAPDQLRQRVAWALGQVIVISGNKNIYPPEFVPYLQLLSKHAFGNYRNLLKDITLSPQMGKYLDMANSVKPMNGSSANENFPRELMQLFTIGLVQLNPDGSTKLDAQGKAIPTYTQADVRQFALALTGWTFPTAPGATPRCNNWENFSAPQMEVCPSNHDTTAKTLLNGAVLPANQTPMQDVDGVLDNLFNHPNMGPFLATRLIRFMVMSNPSSGYIQRVASVFNNNGAGVRGDLKAVVKAILTDSEARNDTPGASSGRVKDPVYAYVSFVRALDGSIPSSTQTPYIFSTMSMPISSPPSVFGYYSPSYRIPYNPALFGPEFQVFTPSSAVILGNEFHQMLNNPGSDPMISLAPYQAVASNINNLLDTVNQRLFYGRMPAGLRTALNKAVTAAYDHNQRVVTALYLSAISGHYAVQY